MITCSNNPLAAGTRTEHRLRVRSDNNFPVARPSAPPFIPQHMRNACFPRCVFVSHYDLENPSTHIHYTTGTIPPFTSVFLCLTRSKAGATSHPKTHKLKSVVLEQQTSIAQKKQQRDRTTRFATRKTRASHATGQLLVHDIGRAPST